MPRPVRDVVVVARDAEGWIAALGLHRAVGGIGVRVRVVELPSALTEADAHAGLPSLGNLHGLLGLPEIALFRACRAAPALGRRYVDWSPATAFIHAYDIQRPALDGIDLLQFWAKAQRGGLDTPLEAYSLAAAAARAGRVDDRPGGPDSLRGFVPGLHLHALPYARLLRAGVVQNGIGIVPGPLRSIERKGDRVLAVHTPAGERVAADLFVDASGAEAALIGGSPGGDLESWTASFGADRLITGSAPPLRQLPAFAEIVAFPTGWAGLFALQNRTAVLAACAAEGRSEDELIQAIAAAAGVPLPALAHVRVQPFAPGARLRPWIGNCVAVGTAAASLEPLDADGLHLVQAALSNLVSLWPVDADHQPEAGAYNAAFASHLTGLRDFTLAHHMLNGRVGEPYWDRARAVMPPATLAAKLSLFAARGQVALGDDETFAEQNWSAIFAGHGLVPRSWDPKVDAVPEEERQGKFNRLLQVIAEEVGTMPSAEAWIAARAGAR